MNGLISIIIPVYNHAHTLVRTFTSINNQTYHSTEVIVVDDGSIDDFSTTIEKIQCQYPLKVIRQENAGASAARNRGFKEATGEFVIFWDADTIAKPEMLTVLKKQLDDHPEAAFAYCQFKFGWKKFRSQSFNIYDLCMYNYIDTTSLVRTSALKMISGPFDGLLKRFQDWDLWLTLGEHSQTGVFVPKVLFKKIVTGRVGYSSWLPSFVYRLPWLSSRVQKYNEAREIIKKKHHLMNENSYNKKYLR